MKRVRVITVEFDWAGHYRLRAERFIDENIIVKLQCRVRDRWRDTFVDWPCAPSDTWRALAQKMLAAGWGDEEKCQ